MKQNPKIIIIITTIIIIKAKHFISNPKITKFLIKLLNFIFLKYSVLTGKHFFLNYCLVYYFHRYLIYLN